MRRGCRARILAAAALVAGAAACGQKGPPLAPLRLVPAAVSDVTLRRVEDRARLRFVLPTQNANGPGPVELDRVEIYAVTVAPSAAVPANRDLLTKTYLVGQIAVQPPARGGEETPAAPTAQDTRPAPGDTVTFEEVLTTAQLTPAPLPESAPAPPAADPSSPAAAVPGAAKPEEAAAEPAAAKTKAARAEPGAAKPDAPSAEPAAPDGAGTAPEGAPAALTGEGSGAAAGTAAPPGAPPSSAAGAEKAAARTGPVRVYIVRGVTRGGRPGPPSARVELPIGPLPAPPGEPATRLTETGVTIEWAPPAGEQGLAFNVYGGDAPDALNATPVTGTSFEHTAATLGEEHCYRVRSVRIAGTVAIEGPASEPACVTPRDIFPPAAPTGLAAVPTPGQISLIWNANAEPDVAGYLVLRGDAPDGQLQALTPSPIRETSYRDTTVQPGVRYVYAVIAVDGASPPNTSATSERVEETAR